MVNQSWRTKTSAATVALVFAGFAAHAEPLKLLPPETGAYHGTFPDLADTDFGPEIGQKTVDFENLVGNKVAYVIVGNHWFSGINAPVARLRQVAEMGKFPIVQVMPWSLRARDQGPDAQYTLFRIAQGGLDAEIRRYAEDIKASAQAVGISFAPEMNGSWYPWSGLYEGGATTTNFGDPEKADGPEIYQAAYRRLIDIFRQVGAENVTRFFHYTATNRPATEWNKASLYYPGDEFIDWVAVSSYSAQQTRDVWEDFTVMMDDAYAEFEQMAPEKPFAVLEFGTIEDPLNPYRKSDWISNTMAAINAGRYPKLKALSYWHERSWDETNPAFNLRLDSSTQSLTSYVDGLSGASFALEAKLSGPVAGPKGCYCGFVDVRGAKTCAVWRPGDKLLKEYRQLSSCTLDVCKQLFSPESQAYCGNTYIPYP